MRLTANTHNYFRRAVIAGAVILLLSGNISSDIKTIKGERKDTPEKRLGRDYGNFLDLMEWVKRNTGHDQVFVTDRAPWMHLLSGRATFTFPWSTDREKVIASIDKNGVDYIVITPFTEVAGNYLLPAMEKYQHRFTLAHQRGKSKIYKVEKEDAIGEETVD